MFFIAIVACLLRVGASADSSDIHTFTREEILETMGDPRPIYSVFVELTFVSILSCFGLYVYNIFIERLKRSPHPFTTIMSIFQRFPTWLVFLYNPINPFSIWQVVGPLILAFCRSLFVAFINTMPIKTSKDKQSKLIAYTLFVTAGRLLHPWTAFIYTGILWTYVNAVFNQTGYTFPYIVDAIMLANLIIGVYCYGNMFWQIISFSDIEKEVAPTLTDDFIVTAGRGSIRKERKCSSKKSTKKSGRQQEKAAQVKDSKEFGKGKSSTEIFLQPTFNEGRRGRKKEKVDNPFLDNLDQKLFTEPKRDDKFLPAWALKLTHRMVYELIGSLQSIVGERQNMAAIEDLNEFLRTVKLIRVMINNPSQMDMEFLREFVLKTYKENESFIPRPEKTYTLPSFSTGKVKNFLTYVPDVHVKMPRFPNKSYEEGILESGSDSSVNVLHTVLKYAYKKRLFMSPVQVKQRIRSMINSGKDNAHIKAHIVRNCAPWNPFDPKEDQIDNKWRKDHPDMDLPDDGVYRHTLPNGCVLRVSHAQAWFLPYIPPSFFYLRIKNEYKFWVKFGELVNETRRRLFIYVDRYLTIRLLSHSEREAWRLQYRNAFIEVMRRPKIQTLFMQGDARSAVIDYVWRECQAEIYDTMIRNPNNIDFISEVQRREDKSLQHNVEAGRKQKTFDQLIYTVLDDFAEDEFQEEIAVPVVVDPVKQARNAAKKERKNKAKQEATDEEWDFQPTSGFSDFITRARTFATPVVSRIPDPASILVDVIVDHPTWYATVFTLLIVFAIVGNLVPIYLGYYYFSIVLHIFTVFYGYHVYQRVSSRSVEIAAKVILDAHTKNHVIAIKTAIHAVYHALRGEYSLALMWLTNFAVTHPEMLYSMPTLKDIRNFVATSGSKEIHLHGVTYVIADHNKMDYLAMTNMDPEQVANCVANGLLVEVFQTTAGGSSFMGAIMRVVATTGLTGMDEKDLRFANAQFQYVNHRTKAMSDAVDCATTAVSFISRLTIGIDPADPLHQLFCVKLYRLCKRIDNYATMPAPDTNSVEHYEAILADWEIAQQIRTDVLYQTVWNSAQTQFNTRYTILQNLASEARAILALKNMRCAPLCLLFTGKPKTGKTAATEHILKIMSYIDGIEDSDLQKFSYNVEATYWEGYKQQPFVIMDDFGKLEDIKFRAKEAADIIAMVNTSRFNLQMAFEQKGKAFFDSKYVLISTNLWDTGIDKGVLQLGLSEPTAFLRRCHLIIHAVKQLDEGMELMDHPYRIDVCCFKREYEGKFITARQLPILVAELRKIQLEYHQKHQMDAQRVMELYGDPEALGSPTFVDFAPTAGEVEELDIGQDSVPQPLFSEEDGKKSSMFNINPDIMSDLRGFVTEFCVSPTVRNVALCILTMMFAGAAYKAYQSWFSAEDFDETSKVIKANLPGTRKMSGEVRVRKAQYNRWKRVDNFHKTSSSHPADSVYAQVNKWVGQLVGVGYDETGKRVNSCCTVWRLKDRYFAAPAHFFDELRGAFDLEFQFNWNGEPGKTFKLEDDAVTLASGRDVAIFKMPLCVSSIPKELLGKVFSNGKPDVHKVLGVGHPAHMVCINNDLAVMSKVVSVVSDVSKVNYTCYGNTYLIEYPIKYIPISSPGDSGGPIVIRGDQQQLTIVGIQCGNTRGGKPVGVAMSLNRDFLTDLIAFAEGMEITPEVEEQTLEPTSGTFPFSDYRIADQPCPINRRSNIKRSELYGYFGHATYIPARFNPFTNENEERVDPLYKGIAKMTQEVTPDVVVHPGVFDYLDKWYGWHKPGEVRTLDEALNGWPGVPAIEYGTSPGYPYNLNKAKGKSGFIDIMPDGGFSVKPPQRYYIRDCIDKLKNGQQIEVYWADFMKDETREYKKVLEGKTRIVSSCPLHFLIILRMYFLDFITHVQGCAANAPVSVGINMHSREHLMLYERMSRTAGSVIAGDFSNYDGKLPKSLGKVFVDYVNRWYNDGPVNARVRELLVEHICTATHICGPYIFRVFGGNPSGNPMTSIYNSFCNIFMCYTILVCKLNMKEEDFSLAVYGDDNIITTVREGLRASALTPYFMELYGMTYTHYTKEESDVHDTMLTIRYLGRQFVPDERGFMRAPLDITVIRESLYWYKSKADRDEVMLSMFDAALTEFAHHGEKVFHSERKRLLRAIEERIPHLLGACLARARTYTAIRQTMYFS